MLPFTGAPQSWNELIASLPLPHLLQTWEWSQVKTKYGWQPMPFVWSDLQPASRHPPLAAAMILKRSLPVGGFAKKMCVLYIPKGPNLDWNDTILRERVLGDLHGCYSCLKAALLQADFFRKVQAWHDDPANNPKMVAVLLGVRIMDLKMTTQPLMSGVGFILSGLGGILAALAFCVPGSKALRATGAVALILAPLKDPSSRVVAKAEPDPHPLVSTVSGVPPRITPESSPSRT